ncbi:HAD hydrolase family protein [bacterium]|nr:HAD hydrolase family protein [bacterium]
MSKYKLFVTDVDGVLTDGSITYMHNEDSGISEIKNFNARDGSALKKIMSLGIVVAFISGRNSKCVEYRAAELDIKEVHMGIHDKISVFQDILDRYNIKFEEAVYVGDDRIDIECLNAAGLSCVPADCLHELKNQVDYVCEVPGGRGVISEILRIFGEDFEV